MAHIYVSINKFIIGLDKNSLPPVRRQTIVCNNADILLSEQQIVTFQQKYNNFHTKKMYLNL